MKDQELKELAKLAASPCEMYSDGECVTDNDCTKCGIALDAAKAIQAAGYRKASEVAREIGDEIAKHLMLVTALPKYVAIEATVLIGIIEKYAEVEG